MFGSKVSKPQPGAMIVTGASQGIGVTKALLERGYNVVANSRSGFPIAMGAIADVDDIVAAVVYLIGARHVTGEVLHVDAGAHTGKW